MSEKRPVCPRCGSHHTVKNGRIHNKKLKHKCLDCGRQFVENPTKKYSSPRKQSGLSVRSVRPILNHEVEEIYNNFDSMRSAI